MHIQAKLFNALQSNDVPVVEASAPMPGGFFVDPGVYELNGNSYDLSQGEGYFVIAQDGQVTRRGIIYQNDILAAVSGSAWAVADGGRDAALAQGNLNARAKYYTLSMLCGETVEWAKTNLRSLGIECRTVRTLTAEPLNNSYDGHVSLEVKVDGVWRWADLSNKLLFSGSVVDSVPAIVSTAERIAPIAIDRVASSPYDASAFFQISDSERLAFAQRVLQVPGFDVGDGTTEFFVPDSLYSTDDERVEIEIRLSSIASSYRFISKAEFAQKYY